ncbi:MAG: hypothetical protein CBB70_05435 [Planctomycetaceae bacterium TMED10]|nr:MAG: hypothetical protein CBB70_05435 [Planctomycetaceae bacterium TMED10]
MAQAEAPQVQVLQPQLTQVTALSRRVLQEQFFTVTKAVMEEQVQETLVSHRLEQRISDQVAVRLSIKITAMQAPTR